MDSLHIKADPGADGVTRIVTLSARDLDEKKRHRKIFDLASFVEYLKRWGDANKGTIYWTTQRVAAVLDEQDLKTGRGDQDTVIFDFDRPTVAKRWLNVLGKQLTHTEFKEFLELRHAEIEGGASLYTKIANLSLAQTFTYDGKLDSDHSYQIAFKSDAGADVATLPKTVEVFLPLIEGLEKPFKMSLRLKFKAPTSAEEKPRFWLVWDDQADVFEEAARAAAAAIAEGLPAWLSVHGEPNLNGCF